MIKKRCFVGSWIESKHNELKTDPILIEKAIYVFELLANLPESGVDLVFKGGTSLLLLIPELRRLSIDLDIMTSESDRKLEKVFGEITRRRLFIRWEEDRRNTKHEIPKKHFKFYYKSCLSNKEEYVLLDVLNVQAPFSKMLKKPISAPIFDVDKEIKVPMPTIDGLAGDKLTAFAPTTIGIPYGVDKSMEIVKQLFDLGILFEYVRDLSEIHKTYKAFARVEAGFRGIKLNVGEFLNDSLEAAFLISQMDFKGATENSSTEEIRKGIRSISTHTVSKYTFLNAKEDASKIACVAALLRNERLSLDIDRVRQGRVDIQKIKDVQLSERYAILNKLKSISPDSYYLWAVAIYGDTDFRDMK